MESKASDEPTKGTNAAESEEEGCEPRGEKPADSAPSETCEQSLRGLDALNFLMADTQTGVGPYLAIFLQTLRHYDPAKIGMVLGAGSIAQVVAQTPAGAWIDQTRRKRLIIAAAALLIGIAALMFIFLPQLWATIAAQVLLAGSGAVFAPAIAALSLGIAGHRYLTQRQSRNEAFNHAGNVVAALTFGY